MASAYTYLVTIHTIAGMNNRKQAAFLALYEPVHNQFERFCRARVYGQMEFRDLMNETLLQAYRKFDQLRSEEAFLGWLFIPAIVWMVTR